MLATNGFEEAELFEPRSALLEAGAAVTLVSIDKRPILGVVYDADTGTSRASTRPITPDVTLDEVNPEQYDALVLPGGVTNPDTLRLRTDAIALIRGFVSSGKPVAAICHAPWLLIDAGAIEGRRMTGWYSIRTDLANAGARVVDEAVVVDRGVITSRMPSDIPAFTEAVKAALSEVHARRVGGDRAQPRRA